MLACTAFVVAAFFEGRMIGFGRVVEDGQMAMHHDIFKLLVIIIRIKNFNTFGNQIAAYGF